MQLHTWDKPKPYQLKAISISQVDIFPYPIISKIKVYVVIGKGPQMQTYLKEILYTYCTLERLVLFNASSLSFPWPGTLINTTKILNQQHYKYCDTYFTNDKRIRLLKWIAQDDKLVLPIRLKATKNKRVKAEKNLLSFHELQSFSLDRTINLHHPQPLYQHPLTQNSSTKTYFYSPCAISLHC